MIADSVLYRCQAECSEVTEDQRGRAQKYLDWLHDATPLVRSSHGGKLRRVEKREARERARQMVQATEGAPRGIAFLIWAVLNPTIWSMAIQVLMWWFNSYRLPSESEQG